MTVSISGLCKLAGPLRFGLPGFFPTPFEIPCVNAAIKLERFCYPCNSAKTLPGTPLTLQQQVHVNRFYHS